MLDSQYPIINDHINGLQEINCFGNFAMIGSEANSSGSSWNPKAKIEHYSDNRINAISVASIKFRIMMQKCKDNANKDVENGMEWIYNDMKEHQENMLNIIFLSETDS